MEPSPPGAELIGIPAAATLLGLAPTTLRHQIKNGKLRATKVGRDWLLAPDEVERYRLEHRQKEEA
jgi:excisionase family DNA binding protein